MGKDRFPEAAARQSEDFGDRYTSSSIQPPVLAVAVERVFRATGDTGFLARCLPPTAAFYRWLKRVRDPDEDDLIAIIQPDESGVDASPKFDPLMEYPRNNTDLVRWIHWLYGHYAPLRFDDRAILALDLFQVEELFVNVFFVLGLQSLTRLYTELGDSASATEFATQAERSQRSLIDKCYDEQAGLFFDLAGVEERQLRTATISGLAPLALPTLDRAIVERLLAHLRDPDSFATRYPVPSVSRREPTFMPGNAHGFIWRGPTWINSNWLIGEGLRVHQAVPERTTLVDATCELVLRSGFREYYHPDSGEGFGSRDHSWSTLVLDMLDG